MPQWTVRMPDELAEQVLQAAQTRGFSSPRAFVRDALRKELNRGGPNDDVEVRVAASVDRLSRELQKLGTAQQAQFALTDALAKVFLMCVPEPPSEAAEFPTDTLTQGDLLGLCRNFPRRQCRPIPIRAFCDSPVQKRHPIV